MPWLRLNWRAISSPWATLPTPAGGTLPPQNASAVPTGRPRRRKAPPDWAPPNPRKSRLLPASLRKNRLPVNRANRSNPNCKPSPPTQKPHPPNPKLNPLLIEGPLLPIGAPGTGVVAAATTLIVLPAVRTIPLRSVNLARLGPRAVIRHRQPPKKKPPQLRNVRRAPRPRNPLKSQRQVFAAVTAIPALLRALRNSK